MRKDGTKAEALLWTELKAKRLGGHHFVRQHPMGPYIADFVCRRAKLIVEVDGSQHADSLHDRKRDEYFRSKGYSTIRFWNDDVIRQRRSVCETILAALIGQLAKDVAAPDLHCIFAPANSSKAGA